MDLRMRTAGMRTLALVATALVAGTALAAQDGEGPEEAEDAAAEAVTTTQGVFTDEQATRGEDVFWTICSECHFEEDFGGPFVQSWAGARVKDLLDEVIATMPEDNPGGMPPEQYLDILTYMFKLNGMPTGEDEMTLEDAETVEIAVDLSG